MTPLPDDAVPADLTAGGQSLLSPVVAGTPVEPLTGDRAFLDAMLEFESALAAALADVGLVSRASADAVVAACGDHEVDAVYLRELALRAASGGNPAIPLVSDLRARVAGIGAAGIGAADRGAEAVVHRGATSQDVVDTALMLLARRTLERIETDLQTAAAHAAELADGHRRTPACGRTLTQQAMPTTFGFRAAGWLAGLTEATSRVRTAVAALPVQLGGPVGTAAEYGEHGPALLDALAARLGLVAPTLAWHTRRTPVVDVGHALVVSCGAVGKIAADVLVMAQTEVGELAEVTGGPSSSMAHKANPTQAVLVSAAARQVPTLVAVLGASMTAEQERPAGAWHAEWEPLRQALRVTGAAVHRCATMLAGLQVDTVAMQRNVDHLVEVAGLDRDVVAAAAQAVAGWVDRALTADELTRGS